MPSFTGMSRRVIWGGGGMGSRLRRQPEATWKRDWLGWGWGMNESSDDWGRAPPQKTPLKTETSVFLDSEEKGILLHILCNQLWLASAREGDCVGGSPIQSILSPSIWSTIQKLWETEKQSKFGVPKIWSFDWVTSGRWWDKRWSRDFFFFFFNLGDSQGFGALHQSYTIVLCWVGLGWQF